MSALACVITIGILRGYGISQDPVGRCDDTKSVWHGIETLWRSRLLLGINMDELGRSARDQLPHNTQRERERESKCLVGRRARNLETLPGEFDVL